MEDDEETNVTQKSQHLMLEEGYDADQEEGSDSSEGTDQRPVKSKKHSKERRKVEEPRNQQCPRGLIIYPRICSFLLEFLQVCYFSGPPASDRCAYYPLCNQSYVSETKNTRRDAINLFFLSKGRLSC